MCCGFWTHALLRCIMQHDICQAQGSPFAFKECWYELIKFVPKQRSRQSYHSNTETWSERCSETVKEPRQVLPPVLRVRPEREAQRLDPDPEDVLVRLTGAGVNQESSFLHLGLKVLYHFEISWGFPLSAIIWWVNITGTDITLTERLTWYGLQQVEGVGPPSQVVHTHPRLLGRGLTLVPPGDHHPLIVLLLLVVRHSRLRRRLKGWKTLGDQFPVRTGVRH